MPSRELWHYSSTGLEVRCPTAVALCSLALTAGCGRARFEAHDARVLSPDASSMDAALPPDAPTAPSPDAWSGDAAALDAPALDAPSSDAGQDALAAIDAGTDAGPPTDAGSDAAPPPGVHNVIFLSQPLPNGDLGGLAGADARCAMDARASGLGGTFVAYLSTSTVDAIDRLGSAEGWVRPDGLPVALSRADLVAGNLIYPPVVDSLGVRHPPDAYPVTGTETDGRLMPGQTCSDWTSATGPVVGGILDRIDDFWGSRAFSSCAVPVRLFCMQIDHDVPPPDPAPIPGRTVFFALRGGIAETPDEACIRAAAGAGLPGSYHAFVATSTSAATDRFALDRWPWVNTRGRLVAATLADLTTDGLWAPIAYGAMGERGPFIPVATGASGPTVRGTLTCLDWTSSSAGEEGYVSTLAQSSPRWFLNGASECTFTGSLRFYCLED